jgi:hypothetical protein
MVNKEPDHTTNYIERAEAPVGKNRLLAAYWDIADTLITELLLGRVLAQAQELNRVRITLQNTQTSNRPLGTV